MTIEEAIKMLKAKRYCMELETSGTEEDCNNRNCDECPFNYDQGNIGEQKEALDLAIKALEKSKRYRSVWLEEHDAEPFCYKSILDTKTNEVYVCKGDAEHFKQYGMTIEKREGDAK